MKRTTHQPPAPLGRPELLRARAAQLIQAVRAFRPVTILERQVKAKSRDRHAAGSP